MSVTRPDAAAGEDAAPLVPILLSLGTALSRRGRHHEAIGALRQALAEPEDKPVHTIATALVGAQLAADDREGALRTCLELAPQAPAAVVSALRDLVPVLRPALLQPVADQLATVEWSPVINRGDLENSVRRGLLTFLVRAHLMLGDPDRSAALLAASESLVDGDAELLVLLADTQARRWRLDEAEQALLRAEPVARGGEAAEDVTHRLVRLYEQTGRSTEVLARLPEVTASRPEVAADLHAIKALALLHLGEHDAAKQAAATARELAATSAVARAETCVYLADHDYPAAKETAEAGLAKHQQNRALAFLRFQVIVESGEELTEIDRALRRFLGRMEKRELDECVARSVRTRAPDDPALHYFLGMLHRSLDRTEDSLSATENVIGLLDGMPTEEQPRLVGPAAHRLRALLLESDRPAEAVEEYATAGRLAFEQGAFDLAIELIRTAGRDQELGQSDRWVLADSLLLSSFVPTEPKGVAVERVEEAVDVWRDALDRRLPEPDLVWAYVSRARMCLQLARVRPDPYPLVTEALVYLECFYSCSLGTDTFFEAFGLTTRLLGLHGMCTDLFDEVVGPPAAQPVDQLPFDELVTAAANAGDLDRMRRALDTWELAATDPNWRGSQARFHILNEDPAAAIASLDAVEEADRWPFTDVWMRIKADWMRGDLAAVDVDTATAAELGVELAENYAALAGWLYLIAGDADRARELFAGETDNDSWISSIDTEVALTRLVGKDRPAEADTETAVARFITECRSFEDVLTLRLMIGLLARRYDAPPDGALYRLEALAKDRLATDDGWPLDRAADLAYLERTAAGREDGAHARVAVLAAQGRAAITARDWSGAISAYRSLIPQLDLFPEAETGFARIATELREVAATRPDEVSAVVAELTEAVTELRAAGSRRVSLQPPELVVGEMHLAAGDVDRARALFESALALPLEDELRGHFLTRLHVLSTVGEAADSASLLGDALRTHRAAGQSPAMSVYQGALDVVREVDPWRRLLAAWERYAADAASTGLADVADELPALVAAGRHGLAGLMVRAGRLAEAETAYRDAVAVRTGLFGAEHEVTLASRHELARTLQALGELEWAEAEHRAVAEIRERKLGKQDVATVTSRWELAWTRYNIGDLATAETDYREVVVPGLRAASGAFDRSTLAARHELGMTLAARGEWDAAVAEFGAVADAMRAVSGPDHPDTLTVRHELAEALLSGGELARAEAEFRAVADGREANQGPADPNAVTARFRQWLVVRLLGRSREAGAGFAELLDRQREILGEEHPDTLATRHQLAMTLAEREMFDDAAQEYASVTDSRIRVLGEDDVATVTSRRELASALLNLGDASAVLHYRAVLAARARTLGERDPVTLEVRRELAFALYTFGQLDDAEQEYREVVADRRAVSGDRDRETQAAWFGLGLVLVARADWAGAVPEFRDLLVHMRAALGEEHPDTLTVREEFAKALFRAGEPAAAVAELRSVVDGWTRTSGPEGVDTLPARRTLAAHLAETGDLTAAEGEYQSVLAVQERLGGADDLGALSTRWDLAGLLVERGELHAALADYERVVEGRTTVLGPDDPSVLAARSRYALVLYAVERYEQAGEEFADLLDRYVAMYGEGHLDTLVTRFHLGLTLARLADWERSAAELRTTAIALAEVSGADHQDTLDARYELGMVLQAAGDWAGAEAELGEVALAWERVAGPDHPSALLSRYHLGITQASAGRLTDAAATLREVLERETRVQGADHPSTLTTRHRIADVLASQGEIGAAAEELRAVVASRTEALGADDPVTMSSRQLLGMVLADTGDLAAAEVELRAVVDFWTDRGGPDNDEVLLYRYRLANVLAAQDRWDESETELRAVLDGEVRTLGADHPNALVTRHELAGVLAAQGKTAEAVTELRAVVADRERVLGTDAPGTVESRAALERLTAE
ncbi:MAG TPA: tetratricopeptide repeat protein [Actinophytocola sp.]|nr:tetratricopeptide repeat protein [Actinophytocola sp.]